MISNSPTSISVVISIVADRWIGYEEKYYAAESTEAGYHRPSYPVKLTYKLDDCTVLTLNETNSYLIV